VTTPRPNRVDLHCHTARSDGILEPLELFRQLAAAATTLVAVTDHDTVAGLREIRQAGLGGSGSTEGPRILAGVEINTTADKGLPGADGLSRKERELHIIGLGFDPDDQPFAKALTAQRAQRMLRREAILDKLAAMGRDVRPHMPSGAAIDSAGRPHIARALVDAGYATSVQDAFDRYLGVDGPGYVSRQGMGPREAISTIHAAGGITMLAHRSDAPEHPELMGALIEAGLDGVEVYHQSFDEDEVARMARFADEHALLPSGGSDYHGDDDMSYATAQARTHVPDSVGARVLERLGA
jgi:predicted metal-dependent phosphoesterase TrpH